jgi:small subunit ribosomal protein S4
MGDPKRQRKKYEAPRFPWSTEELEAELKILGEYGLRNKRELRRHYHLLSKYRTMARELQAKPLKERTELEKQLLNKLASIKLVPDNAVLDNVLDLSIEDILERRLQTYVFKSGMSKTPQQARQLVTHGHISIGRRKVTSPSYILKADEEKNVKYTSTSPYAKDSSLIWGGASASTASVSPRENMGDVETEDE